MGGLTEAWIKMGIPGFSIFFEPECHFPCLLVEFGLNRGDILIRLCSQSIPRPQSFHKPRSLQMLHSARDTACGLSSSALFVDLTFHPFPPPQQLTDNTP
jgi:hypothetical protein